MERHVAASEDVEPKHAERSANAKGRTRLPPFASLGPCARRLSSAHPRHSMKQRGAAVLLLASCTAWAELLAPDEVEHVGTKVKPNTRVSALPVVPRVVVCRAAFDRYDDDERRRTDDSRMTTDDGRRMTDVGGLTTEDDDNVNSIRSN